MKIVTDSAADIPPAEAIDELIVAPLFIQFPEQEVSSDSISIDDFYDRLRAMRPKIPTTSQPSAGVFAEIYRWLAAAGEEILSIHISSGLSGTIEAAKLGAQQALNANVTFFDSLTLSGGQRYLVLAAVNGIRKGFSSQAILAQLERMRAATEVIYTLDTLEYLARGGRIGRVQALAGSLLKIKPVIKVDKEDGKYSTVAKSRTIKQAMETITDYLEKTYNQAGSLMVSVMHGQLADQARELSDMLCRRLPVEKLEILRISPVLGVHTGPGVVGAAVVPLAVFQG
jgi:DegV family protein with EDD domain